MGYKIDLHTHSTASPDGSLTAGDYRRMLESGRLDFVAVTDHNTASMALKLHEEIGERIIVGEEIATESGEIIGLYLKETIPPRLTAVETVRRIREQGGLVYIPHPFETVRKGMPRDVLEELCDHIDIVEVQNGRAVFQNFSSQASAWAAERLIPGAAGSDAHGQAGWGRTYSVVKGKPERGNLRSLLRHASYQYGRPGILGIMYPKLNRLKKRMRHA
jgi:predicted metal-dependent phosphoesterase TrpH